MAKKNLVLILLFGLITWTSFAQNKYSSYPKREFRGIWIATVANIDWPSKQGLTVEQQKQELISTLNAHQKAGINAIMFQIRPTADAFYTKSREPWSHWLTGKQGLAPSGNFDPLEFIIKECHQRGMELHAWFNPYRATMNSNAQLIEEHMIKKRPDLFYTYGGQKLFDPGIPEVRDYIIQVILDVVKGYDIDGVHFDDYFYPYPISGLKINDQTTFTKYPNGFSKIDDWRRNNVDLLVKMANDSIHHYKKHVKFGISPFGIWKNYRQDTLGSKTNGLSNYSELFADSRKWVQEGWVDYINPQIYFTMSRQQAPFGVLLDWWSKNTFERHLYIGHAAYLVRAGSPNFKGEAAWKSPSEIPNQLRMLRSKPEANGSIFFSSKSMNTVAKSLTDSLTKEFYKYPALPPQMPWLDAIKPNAPQKLLILEKAEGISLNWEAPQMAKDGETASGYVVYRFEDHEEINIEDARYIVHISYLPVTTFLDKSAIKGKNYVYVISALDRLKNESEPLIGPKINF